MNRRNLRQKTYGVFTKPYSMAHNVRVINQGTVSRVPNPATPTSPTSSVVMRDGEPWMLNYTSTSFTKIRARVKELIGGSEFSLDDIIVTELISVNILVTPLA